MCRSIAASNGSWLRRRLRLILRAARSGNALRKGADLDKRLLGSAEELQEHHIFRTIWVEVAGNIREQLMKHRTAVVELLDDLALLSGWK
jgi:hypothetical protein